MLVCIGSRQHSAWYTASSLVFGVLFHIEPQEKDERVRKKEEEEEEKQHETKAAFKQNIMCWKMWMVATGHRV